MTTITAHNQSVRDYYAEARKSILRESENWKPVNKLIKNTSMLIRDHHKPGSTVKVFVVTDFDGGKERIPVRIPGNATIGQNIEFQAEWKVRPFVQYVVDTMVRDYQNRIKTDIDKNNGTANRLDYYIEGFCGAFDEYMANSDDEEDLLNHTEIDFICCHVKRIIEKWYKDMNPALSIHC